MPTNLKVTGKDAIAFAKEAKLPALADKQKGRLALDVAGPPTIDPADVQIIDSAAVLFTNRVTPQHSQDVFSSLLFAQLTAKAQVDPFVDPVGYYKKFQDSLTNQAWLTTDLTFSRYSGSGNQFSVDKVVIELLAAIASQDDLALVNSGIQAIKNLQDGDGRLVFWEHETHNTSNGAFRIGLVDEVNGVPYFKMGAFYMNSQTSITKLLWFSWSSAQANFEHDETSISLDDQLYPRDVIVSRLVPYYSSYSFSAPLPPPPH